MEKISEAVYLILKCKVLNELCRVVLSYGIFKLCCASWFQLLTLWMRFKNVCPELYFFVLVFNMVSHF